MTDKKEIHCRVWPSDQVYLDLTVAELFYFDKEKLHRTNGPALEFVNGGEQWRVNGQLHRTDGPAAINLDGVKMWWLNGLLHRTDGPAVIYPEGGCGWWINGCNLDGDQVEKWIQENSIDLSIEEDQIAFKLRFS